MTAEVVTVKLSPREAEALQLVADGNHYKKAAGVMGVQPDTVNEYMRSVLNKLAAVNRAHAVAIGLRRGLIS